MMDKIYIVTDGDYSDYHICAVFLDEAAAKQYTESVGGNVEPWGVFEMTAEEMKGLTPHTVQMMMNGDLIRVYGSADYGLGEYEQIKNWGHENLTVFSANILARDDEHAIKIANELRIRWIVENNWIQPSIATHDHDDHHTDE